MPCGVITFPVETGMARPEPRAEMRSFGLHPRFRAHGGAILLAALSLLIFTRHSLAEVRTDRQAPYLNISISGTITQADADIVQGLASDPMLSSYYWDVALDSLGGNAFAAMKIGRVLRKNEASVRVSGKCNSVCPLIYIAGVHRTNAGQIGMHRPYFGSAPLEKSEIEKQYPLILSKLKAYISEMGITDSFYQVMVNTDPLNVKVFDGSAVEAIIPIEDPTYDEVSTSYLARKFGVSTAEIRNRQKDAEKCSAFLDRGALNLEAFRRCDQAIMWGLSEQIYDQRYRRLSACDADGELEKISVAGRKGRASPLALKWESCVRDIMLNR